MKKGYDSWVIFNFTSFSPSDWVFLFSFKTECCIILEKLNKLNMFFLSTLQAVSLWLIWTCLYIIMQKSEYIFSSQYPEKLLNAKCYHNRITSVKRPLKHSAFFAKWLHACSDWHTASIQVYCVYHNSHMCLKITHTATFAKGSNLGHPIALAHFLLENRSL